MFGPSEDGARTMKDLSLFVTLAAKQHWASAGKFSFVCFRLNRSLETNELHGYVEEKTEKKEEKSSQKGYE